VSTPDAALLLAAWERRRCIRCGAPASAVLAGQEAGWEVRTVPAPGGGTRRLQTPFQAEIRDINYCLHHALISSISGSRRKNRC
jgi:methenyltetrahydromethanopterin cyclohydrolase